MNNNEQTVKNYNKEIIPIIYLQYSKENKLYFSNLFRLRQVSTSLKCEVNKIFPEIDILTYINNKISKSKILERNLSTTFETDSENKKSINAVVAIRKFVKNKLKVCLKDNSQINRQFISEDWRKTLDMHIQKTEMELSLCSVY